MNRQEATGTGGGWVGYRPDIKILDCTIRDGGLINDHQFDDAFIRAVYQADVAAGVDYCEFGYKASKRIFSPTKYGPWKFSEEDDIRRAIGEKAPGVKITVMADAERTDYHEDIPPREKSVIDVYRIAAYIHQIPTALEMIKDATEKGYETMLQLMAVSTVSEKDLGEALDIAARSPVAAVYVVDSFGSLYSEEVRALVQLYKKALDGSGKEIGFHAHNNQQLAYANTIEAIIAGASRMDATINGLGRGAGNCPLELLIGFLHNPKFRIRPILECVRDVFVPLAKKMHWGYSIPYAITGQMNQHPRAAIDWHAGKSVDDVVAFYDMMIEEQS